MMRPVELIELMHNTAPDGQSALFDEQLILALHQLEGVVSVSFNYNDDHRPMAQETRPMGMGWRHMKGYTHSRVINISEPEYDTKTGGRTFTLELQLLGKENRVLGTLGITMQFAFLLKDLTDHPPLWLKHGMVCIVDNHYDYLFHTNMSMAQRSTLGDTGDSLSLPSWPP